MGFGLCLREQRGSSHVSCAEGRASRAVNAAEVEGSVIPRLLAILTAFSPSLPFSFLSLSLASLSQNPERACRNHSGSTTQLQVCYLTHAVILFLYGLVWKRIAVGKNWLSALTVGVFRLLLNWWIHSGRMWHFAPRLQRVRKDRAVFFFFLQALLLLMFLWSWCCCVCNNMADAAPKHMALISHPHAELTAEPPSVLMSWPRDARTRRGSF